MARAVTTRKKTTTTRRAPARKTAAAPPPEVAPAVAPDAPQTPDAPGIPELRKKELIDRVVAASGMKKRDVKPVVEAMLSVLGDALSKGEALNLQPFGKAKVTRQKPLDNGEVITTRLRRNHARSAPVSTPLAEPAE